MILFARNLCWGPLSAVLLIVVPVLGFITWFAASWYVGYMIVPSVASIKRDLSDTLPTWGISTNELAVGAVSENYFINCRERRWSFPPSGCNSGNTKNPEYIIDVELIDNSSTSTSKSVVKVRRPGSTQWQCCSIRNYTNRYKIYRAKVSVYEYQTGNIIKQFEQILRDRLIGEPGSPAYHIDQLLTALELRTFKDKSEEEKEVESFRAFLEDSHKELSKEEIESQIESLRKNVQKRQVEKRE